MRETLVVGAGIAGLVVARELVLQGHRVRVLEAEANAGGQLLRKSIAGIPLDAGAEAFATRGGTVRAYLERLGIADRVVASLDAPAWLHARTGTTVPLPAVSLLGIPSAPLAEDVVAVVGRTAAWRGMTDALLPGPVGAKSATLGELVRRRMGDGILERLVAPVVEGIHSKHPDELPVSVAPGLVHHLLRENSLARAVARLRTDAPAGSLVAGLDGGMGMLVDTLLAELDRYGVPIEYGVRVAEVHADRVVLAVDPGASPAGADADELEGDVREGLVVVAAPGLVTPADGRSATRTATHLMTLVIEAGTDAARALAENPRGTGVLVARGTDVTARALTHVSAKWAWVREAAAGREVVRLSYESAPSADSARRDAELLLGVSIPEAAVVAAEATTWLRAGRFEAAPGIPITGEQVSGTGLASVIDHAHRLAEIIGPPASEAAADSSTDPAASTERTAS
ncbi:protoporphyrinogen oxidase [Microcella alkalica]|uniref:Oxygen-dependent protoporphyrinogen oxidase n=1 Tax=Microcella alkalica TaxID=355930 RepID=A0A839EAU5_9MICO|nr:FAD-dependent oxidoreductase [Microcella alkalica]MBA8848597.1 oxygen-dependent protoporphyrinogen oxidase [Microcella alkalica]